MAKKSTVSEPNTDKRKMLVNVGEQRKAWLEAVAGRNDGSSVTEVIKCIIDGAAVEDPESYAGRVLKWRTKAELDALEREQDALDARKRALVGSLEDAESLQPTNER